MSNIKSYTDLKQSKILAEILPIGSADMFIADVFNKEKETHSYNFHILSTWGCNTFEELRDRENKFVHFIPCWSLAALLSVVSEVSLYSFKDGNWNAMAQRNDKAIYGDTDNPVDACYEMIIKLHKLKLL